MSVSLVFLDTLIIFILQSQLSYYYNGRPGLELNVNFTRAMIGTFDVDLISEFFRGFVNHALITTL
jgi:imidazoleglycerol phosphate dehydratase HisB